MIRQSILAGLIAFAWPAGALSQDIAIENARLWTGTQAGNLENMTLLVKDGRIEKFGSNLPVPADMETFDAAGQWVTPGIFSSFSRTGLVEVSAEDSTNDTQAGATRFTASLRASDGFNPAASTLDVTRLEGVTRLAVAPASAGSLIAGQGFLANTSGRPDSVTHPRAFTYIELGESGADLAGGSRSAAWASLRGAFADARGYPGRFITHAEGDSLNRADAQAFGQAVRGQQKILFHAHRASDLRNIIQLKKDNPALDLVIVGADEAWLVANELAASGISVIIDPFSNLPASFSQLAATQRNAERLIEAGVITAFTHLGNSSHQARLVVQVAGNAVANGVNRDQALKAITTNPADIFGLTDYGRIEAGAVADLVVWDGDPLEVMSAPSLILIDGLIQSPESRQTRLRDRYMELDETTRPLAYKK